MTTITQVAQDERGFNQDERGFNQEEFSVFSFSHEICLEDGGSCSVSFLTCNHSKGKFKRRSSYYLYGRFHSWQSHHIS